jgi:acyl-coenzyme A synthetase/AMP-(fatty) acid ligase
VTPRNIAPPDRYNLVDHFLDCHVREGRGDKIAISCDSRKLTYAQVDDAVNRAGNGLRELGIQEEQRVMLAEFYLPLDHE